MCLGFGQRLRLVMDLGQNDQGKNLNVTVGPNMWFILFFQPHWCMEWSTSCCYSSSALRHQSRMRKQIHRSTSSKDVLWDVVNRLWCMTCSARQFKWTNCYHQVVNLASVLCISLVLQAKWFPDGPEKVFAFGDCRPAVLSWGCECLCVFVCTDPHMQ